MEKPLTECGHPYYIVCQLQRDLTSNESTLTRYDTALVSLATKFRHDPPTIDDIMELQTIILTDGRYSDYTSCIVLNFKKLSRSVK